MRIKRRSKTGQVYYTKTNRRNDGQPHPLTAREIQVLAMYAEGFSMKEIAEGLSIAYNTVDKHLCQIKTKLGIGKAVLLVHYAIKHGIIHIQGVQHEASLELEAPR